MDNPLISVIIPVYNGERFIHESIESVIAQTYPHWECLIIDDGSTDNTKNIILGYLSDNRIKYYYQSNQGPSSARNYGLTKSTGDYIQFLDSDDVFIKNRFEILIGIYKTLNNNLILYSNHWVGEENKISNVYKTSRPPSPGKDIDFKTMYNGFGRSFIFIPSSILFKKEHIIGKKWNYSIKYSEDWDFYLSVLYKSNLTFNFVPEELVIYRNSLNGLSKNKSAVIRSNYLILQKWRKKNNVNYILKTSSLITKSVIIKLTNNKAKLILPPLKDNKIILLIIIYVIVPFLLIKELFSILMSKFLK